MAMRLVTAYQGEEHVTSADVGAMQQGIFGADDYVLNIGKKLAATLVTNNDIRIDDGEAVMQGRHYRVDPNTYETVTIDNGTQGMKRKDLIIVRYTKDAETGVEDAELKVLKGEPTEGNPVTPVPVKGNIREGDALHEMLLYTVELNGLNVVGVEPAFGILYGMAEINGDVEELMKTDMRSGLGDLSNVHSAVKNSSNCTVEYVKKGKTVNAYISIRLAATVNQYGILFTFPDGFRPLVRQSDRAESCIVNMLPSGGLQVQSDVPANAWIVLSYSYTTD